MTVSTRRRQRKQLERFLATLPVRLEELDLDDRPELPKHLVKAWRSRRFTVQLFDDPNGLRLSVQRTSDAWPLRTPGASKPIGWDELQELKREVGFGDRWAVEVYPPDEGIVNVAPLRHLWLLDAPPSYGWVSGG